MLDVSLYSFSIGSQILVALYTHASHFMSSSYLPPQIRIYSKLSPARVGAEIDALAYQISKYNSAPRFCAQFIIRFAISTLWSVWWKSLTTNIISKR